MKSLLPLSRIAGLVSAYTLHAAVVEIEPSRDAHLNGSFPDRNYGAADSFIVGGLVTGSPNRAILAFDISAHVPAGAIINSVTLQLTDLSRSAGSESDFGLHRQMTLWTEGTGLGLGPASPGEVTWNSRAQGVEAWSVGGGLSGTDFAATASGTLNTGDGSLIFNSTASLVADVQAWLNSPAQNFGWMLLSSGETISRTARRIASREHSSAPLLTIEYTAVPEPAEVTAIMATVLVSGWSVRRVFSRRTRTSQA